MPTKKQDDNDSQAPAPATGNTTTATPEPAAPEAAAPAADAGEWVPIDPLTNDDIKHMRNERNTANPDNVRWNPDIGLKYKPTI